jgi:hypothetical protein
MVILSVSRLRACIENEQRAIYGFNLSSGDIRLFEWCLGNIPNPESIANAIEFINRLDDTRFSYGKPFIDEVANGICKFARSIFFKDIK